MRFSTLRELSDLAATENKPISQIMIEEQMRETGESRATILSKMGLQFEVMEEAVEQGVTATVRSHSGLTGGDAKKVYDYQKDGKSVLGSQAALAMSMALAVSEVNAAMGRVVATPTAGSCGILPGVLVSIGRVHNIPKETLIQSMFTAGAIGYVIANNASISGAGGGCQAETGSATAMAAGSVVELFGGTPEQVIISAGLALKNVLGLVCDPVAGLVEVPCIIRNGFAAVAALTAADMALAGMKSVIPPDEVVSAMYHVGRIMPVELRETALGGLADTPTAKAIEKKLYGNEFR
ncbi:L-serine ammonia-lyase, iron-sulfur-dependent, subunit alpha [Fodinisporobacter ferrooxydans]|uniref:L-serine dehydratase n=1 Tax=Fodinisporobacter ferrooxydans TaxID=2901836 RepID=A0ABY4CIZ3_9BACL|nr:L-serine ammonia-lyase, iron-sulfur-dependent, subunit alpha [Alicyclobacillaceae bacterium MYW30-H2]